MSKLEYGSVLATHLNGFIQLKRALGYRYTTAAYIVGEMDRFFDSVGLDSPIITKEICDLWMERKPGEAASTYRGRMEVFVQFARYMSDLGLPCHIPSVPKVRAKGFTAHIFSSDEITRFFKACDSLILESLKKDSVIIMLPTLFRLLYATGIRISEALKLKNDDVDLNLRVLHLKDTKNRKERLVPFTDSLSSVLRQYMEYRNQLPVKIDGEYFFLSLAGRACRNDGVIYGWFRTILFNAGIPHRGKHLGPRVHDFRHTFSVHSLVRMDSNGMDIYCSLPILSSYLGHSSLQATSSYVRLCESMYPEIIHRIDKAALNVFPNLIGDEDY